MPESRFISARPGVVIGKKGEDIEALKSQLQKLMGVPVHLNIEEIRKPEIDAQLIAENIAQQLEKRIMFRRAMKRAMQNAMRLGAQGIKIESAGRLNGAEIARTEWYREGRVPLHTLRADIDYGTAEAKTTYGIIGIKVWVYKGETPGQGRDSCSCSGLSRNANQESREQNMLQPARRKFRKEQKGRNTGIATRGNKVSFGEFGLKAIGRGRLTARQIEAARRAMTRHIKRGGRIWIRIFPDKPISQKPAEVRMGNGKGNPEYYVAEIQPGKVLYEMDGVEEDTGARGVSAWPLPSLPIPDHFCNQTVRWLIMKASELRAKSTEELNKEMVELLRAQFGLRMQISTQQSTKVDQLGKVRKDIARVRTLISEKARQA